MSLCICCDSKPKLLNKTISIIGNNDEIKGKLYRSITGSPLIFGEEPTVQKSVQLKNKRIIVTVIQHCKENMTIAEMNVNFASGVILVLDGSKDINDIEDYIKIIKSNHGSTIELEQKRIFFGIGLDDESIELIEKLNPTYFALEPETNWFIKDTETNVYKFVDTL